MPLASPSARPTEQDLDRAWNDLNHALPGSKVSLTVQHRLTACVRDILAFIGVCRELHDTVLENFRTDPFFGGSPLSKKLSVELEGAGAQSLEDWFALSEKFNREHADERRAELEARMAFWRKNSTQHMLHGHRFASSVKALFFFFRALQDACYAVLLEASGQKAGAYSSLNDALTEKKGKKPLKAELEKELPGYVEWFSEFGELRNRMKLGVTTGQGTSSPGPPLVHVAIHKVIESPPQSDIYRQITWVDIEEALRQSTRIVEHATRRVLAGAR
jgi:hypothetical protein